MRALFALLIFTSLHCLAQREAVRFQVIGMESEGIPSVHARNISSGKIAISDNDGFFNMPVSADDTLLLTSVGYNPLVVVLEKDFPREGFILFMQEGTLELDEVTINSIPSIELFKERVLEEIPEDSVAFWYFGVEAPVFRGDKMVEGKIHKKLLYAISQPTSFLYYNLSKKEKEKRKHYQLQKNEFKTDKSDLKYTREWVQEHTGYEGEELTSFIAYCDYDVNYLARTPLYLIMEDMLKKKEAFEKEKKADE